jgi:hypothetical protein
MPFLASTRGSFGPQGRFGRGAMLPNYFGSGVDGSVTISSNTNLVVPNKNGSYDGDYVVMNYSSLTINSGVTLTTDQPCKGLLIYVSGDCTINGTISMRGRGAASNPDAVLAVNGIRYPILPASGTYSGSLSAPDFTGCGSTAIAAVANQPGGSGRRIIQIPKRTSNGGAAQSGGISFNVTGNAGGSGTNSGTDTLTLSPGGGGGGGAYSDPNSCGSSTNVVSGRGGNATAFSGGAGGGGKMSGTGVSGGVAGNGSDDGGEGGDGGNGHCGGVHMVTGGVGNPGGWDQYGSVNQSGYNQTYARANSGTGGVIWLIVGGNLTIGSGGLIDARGVDNTDYTGSRTYNGNYGNGGASGGGVAIVLHKGTYTNSGSINVSGGAYTFGSAAGPGSSGGSGASTVIQVA